MNLGAGVMSGSIPEYCHTPVALIIEAKIKQPNDSQGLNRIRAVYSPP